MIESGIFGETNLVERKADDLFPEMTPEEIEQHKAADKAARELRNAYRRQCRELQAIAPDVWHAFDRELKCALRPVAIAPPPYELTPEQAMMFRAGQQSVLDWIRGWADEPQELEDEDDG